MREIKREEKVFSKNKLTSDFHIEVERIQGGLSVFVYGVTSVRAFSKEEVHLRSGKSSVRVRGSELSISVYDGKAVEILGKVLGIDFV
jgi:hypothetical protein